MESKLVEDGNSAILEGGRGREGPTIRECPFQKGEENGVHEKGKVLKKGECRVFRSSYHEVAWEKME